MKFLFTKLVLPPEPDMSVRCRVQTVRDKWKNSRKNLTSEISANDNKAKIYTLKDEIFKE